MSQNTVAEITIENQQLDVVHEVISLGSTMADSLSLNLDISKGIGQAARTLALQKGMG